MVDVAAAGLNSVADLLHERIVRLRKQYPSDTRRRVLIALAGVPGSGKSTISAALMEALRDRNVDGVALVPMDGFHFPKSALLEFSNPEQALQRRGGPFTFDADAFTKLVTDLRNSFVTRSDEPQLETRVPSFDHAIQDPIQDGLRISSADRVVILEGNYLLLNEPPWSTIAGLVDEKWFVDVPAEVAKQRLIQ
ncbi:hypothetical protein H2199_003258 [Coniosporium tulheliwenetii]|nr:hypothetical protein H2199_003258 [Cladosporium sp. JES 115]